MRTAKRSSALSDLCFSIPVSGLSNPAASRFRRSEPTFLRQEKIGRHLATWRSFRPRACASPRNCPRCPCIRGERYFALPMKHNIERVDDNFSVEYSWRREKKWEFHKIIASGEPQSTPSWVTRSVYYGTLLGYTCCGTAAANTEWKTHAGKSRTQAISNYTRNGGSLRRTIRGNIKSATALSIHCRRFPDRSSKTRDIGSDSRYALDNRYLDSNCLRTNGNIPPCR